jgi:hypothetical protein
MSSIRLVILAAVCLSPALPAAQAMNPRGRAPAGWGAPSVIYPEAWPDALHFSLNDDATRLVALIPYSGSDDNSRHIVVSELAGGTWQEPVVIAQNGAYSDAPMQWLPQQTHPVISGDGTTVAYAGYTGTTFGAYVVNRLPSGGWSAPALLATGLANTHYWISLSRDGNTLALSDYPFFGIQQVYVLDRLAGMWGAPRLIGAGGNPSLSADGSQLAYVSNARATFSERIDGLWSAPQQLTANDGQDSMVEYPQISGDGRAVFYWLAKLVPEGGASIRTAQDLYLIRRTGGRWGDPEKVTASPTLPVEVTGGPAAADRRATRLIYTRAVTATDPLSGDAYVHASHLEFAEWAGGQWQAALLVEMNGYGNYNRWPRLTPDGLTLTFDGGTRYVPNALPVYNALWQMKTNVAPPPPPLPLSTSAVITSAGGSLLSEVDNTRYDFAAGTFTDTATFTHTVWLTPSQPPGGLVSVPGIGGLGRGFTATAFTAGGLPLQPIHPVTVTIGYTGTGSGLAISGTLGLWWLNLGGWAPVFSLNDAAAGVVTATVSHFSQFAVFGETHRAFVPVVAR